MKIRRRPCISLMFHDLIKTAKNRKRERETKESRPSMSETEKEN